MHDEQINHERVKLLGEYFQKPHYGTFFKSINDSGHELVERLRAIFSSENHTEVETSWHSELQASAYWQFIVFQSINKLYSRYKQGSSEPGLAEYTQDIVIEALQKLYESGYRMSEPEMIDHLKQDLLANVIYAAVWSKLLEYGLDSAVSVAADTSVTFLQSMVAITNPTLIKAVNETKNDAELLQQKLTPLLDVFIPELKEATTQATSLTMEPIYGRHNSHEPNGYTS